MGFGLLFIGYFFLMSLPINGIDILPDIVGYLIMLHSLTLIISHCPKNNGFIRARLILLPTAVLSIAIFGCQLAAASGMLNEALEKYFANPVKSLYTIAIGAFHVFLLLGIYQLAHEVELNKLANRSRRIIVLTAVYYLLEIISLLGITKTIAALTSNPDRVISYINVSVYAIGNIWLLSAWALIFTCYMRICLEGDEDMPYRENVHDNLVGYLKSKRKKRKGK